MGKSWGRKNVEANELIILPNVLAIYIRVSTERQFEDGVSREVQEEQGIACADALGWEYVLYNEEQGISGSLGEEDRPEFFRMINDLSLHGIGGIYMYSFDRFSRNDDNTNLIKSKIKKIGALLFIAGKQYDLKNHQENMVVKILSAVAESERHMIIRRTTDGKKKSLENGISGYTIPPYGYTKDANNKLIIDEDEAIIVKEIYRMCIGGKGIDFIKANLNQRGVPTKRMNMIAKGQGIPRYSRKIEVREITKPKKGNVLDNIKVTEKIVVADNFKWDRKSVHSIMRNSIYYGVRIYGGVEYPAPSIITKKESEAVGAALASRRKGGKNTVHFYLLKGLIKCGVCGRGFYGVHTLSGNDNTYRCTSSNKGKEINCHNEGINIDYLNKAVVDSFRSLPDKVEKFLKNYKRSSIKGAMDKILSEIKQDYEISKQKYDRAYDLYVTDGIGDKDRIKELKLDMESQERAYYSSLGQEAGEDYLFANKDKVIAEIKEHCNAVLRDDLSDEDRRVMIQSIITTIVVDKNTDNKEKRFAINYQFNNITTIVIENILALENYVFPYKKVLKDVSLTINNYNKEKINITSLLNSDYIK